MHLSRRLALALLIACALPLAAQTSTPVAITVDAAAPGTPFPHFWEQAFGSGRAILSLRESYRDDLRTVHAATGFQYIRFHGIFMDEAGFYKADKHGKLEYNYSYIDQIYDGLLANGVKPFVELSFMPRALASDPNQLHAFWYKENVSPPSSYADWDAMIQAFTAHLVARYGIDEVSTWYFEVWNEPNIDFWMGNPKQTTYFELYDHTARDVKAVNPRLRVGGPSTAGVGWIPDFITHVHQAGIPIDFISTHIYGNDDAQKSLHAAAQLPRDKMVCTAVKTVHDQIAASPMPALPLIMSEYNASYANEPNVTDSVYMAPWLATTIAQCDGLTTFMSYWSFSDVFEEQGVVQNPFYGGFGLIAADNIPKPAMNAFIALHKLGDTRLPVASDSALVTRRSDGVTVVALWNYAPPDGTGKNYTPETHAGPVQSFTLTLDHAKAHAHVTVWRVDPTHGNVIPTFDAMGRPAFPSRDQIKQLQAAGQPAPPETIAIHNGRIQIDVPVHGLAVLEIH